jgi:hypothetical protein
LKQHTRHSVFPCWKMHPWWKQIVDEQQCTRNRMHGIAYIHALAVIPNDSTAKRIARMMNSPKSEWSKWAFELVDANDDVSKTTEEVSWDLSWEQTTFFRFANLIRLLFVHGAIIERNLDIIWKFMKVRHERERVLSRRLVTFMALTRCIFSF